MVTDQHDDDLRDDNDVSRYELAFFRADEDDVPVAVATYVDVVSTILFIALETEETNGYITLLLFLSLPLFFYLFLGYILERARALRASAYMYTRYIGAIVRKST